MCKITFTKIFIQRLFCHLTLFTIVDDLIQTCVTRMLKEKFLKEVFMRNV
jgi:hypothetical protein